MTARRWLLCLACLASCFSTVVAQQPVRKKAPPPPKRAELFIGRGGATWLPTVVILPSASEVEALAQKLGSRLRNVDPFGLSTFPREGDQLANPASNPAAPVRRTERITLNQALQTLRLTGISLEKKELLIGGHTVHEGDVMMLSFKNEIFLAQVLNMDGKRILFRDVKRKEAGVLPHTLLPHLQMEPMQDHSRHEGLEGKVSPMENSTPQPQ